MNEEEEIDPRQELKRAITNVREAAHKVTAFRERGEKVKAKALGLIDLMLDCDLGCEDDHE